MEPRTPPRICRIITCILNFYPTVANVSDWQFGSGDDAKDVSVSGNVSLNDIQITKDLLLNHMGIAAMPTFLIEQELAAGHLERVLPEYPFGDQVPVYLVYHHRKWLSPAMQVVIEFLSSCFAIINPKHNGS